MEVVWFRNVRESCFVSILIGEKGSGFMISFRFLMESPTLVRDALKLISGSVLLNSSKSAFFSGDMMTLACFGVSISAINSSCETNRDICTSSYFKVLSVRLFVSRNCETSSPIIDCKRDFTAGVFCDSGRRS